MIITMAIVYGIISFITFLTFASDKYKAIHGEWRISEKALILLIGFGGAPGALIAMKTLRHKIRKWYFWLACILSLAFHLGIVIFAICAENGLI